VQKGWEALIYTRILSRRENERESEESLRIRREERRKKGEETKEGRGNEGLVKRGRATAAHLRDY